jgi:[protein-PII] uridylyltransferase
MIPAFEKLKNSRDQLVSRFADGKISHAFQANLTEMMDQYFRKSLQVSQTGRRFFQDKKALALVAVGGYGRKELCLHSDIDIIILFDSKIPSQAKQLTKEIFFPLWDLGFDLGYGVRTNRECLALSKTDFEVLTSIMDARFICGDSPLFLSLMGDLREKCLKKKAKPFARWLAERDQIRTETYGDASFLLEPHLKEGIGGLRDYHHLLWASKAFFGVRAPRDLEYLGKLSHNEYRMLRANLRFISLVRNHLHLLSGRKNDRLSFEYQEAIAEKLGFEDKEDFAAVEQFLSKLHASMSALKSLHRSFQKTHLPKGSGKRIDKGEKTISKDLYLSGGELHFRSPEAILSDHFLLMDIFERSAILGFPPSLESGRLVGEFLFLVDEPYRTSGRAVKSFLAILNAPYAFDALERMFEWGILEKFIPEFSKIKDRVQFDAYHTFPVGMHVLQTLRIIKGLGKEKDILLPGIYTELSNPEPLLVAALFHDIGKASKNHTRRGAEITGRILKRFAYPDDLVEDCLFLVKHHLLLAETATRRDLNDEKAIVQCARVIGTIDRLKMLYLLTWADSRATGPRAWNEWIANLVQELFFKIHKIIVDGELATADAARKVKNIRSQVRRYLSNKIVKEQLEALFEIMAPRYLLETRSRDIVRHIIIYGDFKKNVYGTEPTAFYLEAKEVEREACWELTFMLGDRPGLFSDIAGVLSLNNINILSSRVYTWRDGTGLCFIRVTPPLDQIRPEQTWERVQRNMKDTLAGKLSLAYRLTEKASKTLISKRTKPNRPPHVRFDNASSDFFTIIEVFADDRIGLLYLITRALFELRLDIRIAKIATKADQIADVFYVRDLLGQKVEDENQIEEIKRALLYHLTH